MVLQMLARNPNRWMPKVVDNYANMAPYQFDTNTLAKLMWFIKNNADDRILLPTDDIDAGLIEDMIKKTGYIDIYRIGCNYH